MPQLVRLLVSLLTLSLVLLFGAPKVAAQSQTCDHLISLPGTQTVGHVISAPGIYCLDTDVIMAASFTTGNAINITANYVTLDLNGHKVHGAAAGSATQATGIHAMDRRNVTVKNGTVWGFRVGIFLNATSATTPTGDLVDGVRAELNREIGIFVEGANCIVRNTVIANTGPTTLAGLHNAIGIFVQSQGARVLNNDVLTVTPPGAGLGIGIYVQNADHVLVGGNRITTVPFGVDFNGATGKYRDNLTSGVATPFSFGTDAGGNN